MTRDEVKSKIMPIIEEQLQPEDPAMVIEAARFEEDLHADSLDRVEMMMEIDDAFNLDTSDADADKIKTVGQVIDYVFNRVNQK